MDQKTYHVQFIRTGNSARSIIAESIMNAIGRGRLDPAEAEGSEEQIGQQ